LTPEAKNIIRVESVGSLKINNQHVDCVGEQGRIDNHIMSNLMRLEEFHIILEPEEFLLHDGEVESSSDHVKLPKACPASKSFCETASGTYIWEMPKSHCDLELVTHFNPRRENNLLIDETSKILVNMTTKALFPNCGQREIYHTSYQDIYVVKGRNMITGVRRMHPADVRTDAMIASISAYVMFQAEEKIDLVAASWRHQICRDRFQHKADEPQQLNAELFGLRRGDIYYTFKCPKKTASILEADRCFQDIPITGSEKAFVDPITRLLKIHSPELPCSKRLPMKVKAQNQWIEISPHLRRVNPPEERFPTSELEDQHVDMGHSGIYTPQELEDWEVIVNFPNYRQALMTEITLGSCTFTGGCGMSSETVGVPSYDLQRLVNEGIQELSPWKQVETWIYANGSLLAALVLLLTALQWGLYLILVATAMVKEGPSSAIAVAGLICCSAPQTYGRVQRRQARLRKRETEELYPLQQPSAPL
jgi:hypothetical protein